MQGMSKKLCAGALGISFGIVTGLFMMLFAWASSWWGVGTVMVDQWTTVFPGYTATMGGGVIGFLWGFLEGFITGFLLAAIYNGITCCCRCKCCAGSTSCNIDSNKKM